MVEGECPLGVGSGLNSNVSQVKAHIPPPSHQGSHSVTQKAGGALHRPARPTRQPVFLAVQVVFSPSRGSVLVKVTELPSALGTMIVWLTSLPPRLASSARLGRG